MKQPKRHHKKLFVTLLVLFSIVVLTTGTYAAYTSFGTVKRVVAARTNDTADSLRFSSNYLSPYDLGATEYGIQKYKFSFDSTKDVTMGITVCNYPQDDGTLVNSSDISYRISASVVDVEGQENAVSLDTVEGSLQGGEASQNLHILTVAHDSVNAVCKGYIEVVVTPNEQSSAATRNQKLAAKIQLIPITAQEIGWTGSFTDDLSNPKSLDAFNYQIHGTGKARITLWWNKDKVTLSKWSAQELGITVPGQTITVGGTVDGKEPATSYLLQFYRVGGIPDNETKAEVNGYVTFSQVENG